MTKDKGAFKDQDMSTEGTSLRVESASMDTENIVLDDGNGFRDGEKSFHRQRLTDKKG